MARAASPLSLEASQPTTWDTSTIRGPSMRYLDISGLHVRYKGPGSDDRDAAAVRTNRPVPTRCPIFYYEVEIVNKGRDGFIGIGFAVQDVKLDRLPGWEPHSYGYHGDDGHVFNGRGTGRPYGPIFGTGDWIGVIYNRVERTISFTKKGYDLGIAFENVVEDALYPTVGFRTPDEQILANFGANLETHPFKGDFQAIQREATDRLYAKILSTSVPRASKSQDVIGELVFGYLSHHGYWETASAVAKDVLGDGEAVPVQAKEEAASLQRLALAVGDGDIDTAVKIAERLAPGVMVAHPRVAFALQCQKLCELISAGKDEDAMAYGRTIVAPSCSHPEDRALLDEALTLFAYTNPHSSPAGHLLGTERKSELAADLQRAVRTSLGRREVSALEDLYRQAHAVHAELLECGVPDAALVHDVDECIERSQEDLS